MNYGAFLAKSQSHGKDNPQSWPENNHWNYLSYVNVYRVIKVRWLQWILAYYLHNTGTDAMNLSSYNVLVQGVRVGRSLTKAKQNGL